MSFDGRLSLAFRDISDLSASIPQNLIPKVTFLDLTSNLISDLIPLKDFSALEELVLDNNKITSHTKFPSLPKLQNLWVNRNQISHLTLFIDKIQSACPSLIMLSMLNNEACPNYFNSGSPQQYQDYRHYVINRLPKLQVLDSTPVSSSERAEAHKIYGSMPGSTAQGETTRRMMEQQSLAKKRAENELKKAKRQEEKILATKQKRRRRRRDQSKDLDLGASSSTAPPAPPPVPSMNTNDTLENKNFKDQISQLPELPDIDPDSPKITNPKKMAESQPIFVLPPLPILLKKKNQESQEELGDEKEQKVSPIEEAQQDDEFDGDDGSDWSDSS